MSPPAPEPFEPEVACVVPGCPPIETVIAFWSSGVPFGGIALTGLITLAGIALNLVVPAEAFNISLLAQKGSLFATRPTLHTFMADRALAEKMARDLFRVVASGEFAASPRNPVPGNTTPL